MQALMEEVGDEVDHSLSGEMLLIETEDDLVPFSDEAAKFPGVICSISTAACCVIVPLLPVPRCEVSPPDLYKSVGCLLLSVRPLL